MKPNALGWLPICLKPGKSFPAKWNAIRAAVSIANRFNTRMYVWRCAVCKEYHIAKKAPKMKWRIQ
jgi:hypothetical protein